MNEYIKKLSVTIYVLAKNISDQSFQVELKKTSLSLMSFIKKDFDNEEARNLEFLLELRTQIIFLIGLLDMGRICHLLSPMNAKIISNSCLKFISEIDKNILHTRSMSDTLYSLTHSQMQSEQILAREKVKSEMQHNYLYTAPRFNFTSVPNLNFKNSFVQDFDDANLNENFLVQENVEDGEEVNNKTEFEKNLKMVKLEKSEAEKNEKNEKGERGVRLGKKFENEKSVDKDNAANLSAKNLEKNLKETETENEKGIVYEYLGGNEQEEILERRAKILSTLKKGGGSIKDIAKSIPGISEKTLQRDLSELIREKKVIMLGRKRWSKYYLK